MKKSLFDILSSADKNQRYIALSRYIDYQMAKERIPYHASLEITPICNLNCQMCYIKMTPNELRNSGQKLLRFDDWKYYIDGLCEIGTEAFVLTGGECMLHPDFVSIYQYIYDLGKDVSMITNGSCITDEILSLFISRPPKNIFLTIYGASQDVYQQFCKNGNAFISVSHNIDRLIEKKLPLNLICTLGKGNIDDVNNITDFGKSRGLKVEFAGDLITYGKCDEEKYSKAQIDIFSDKKRRYESLEVTDSLNSRDFYKDYIFPEMDNIKVSTHGINCIVGKHVCSLSWRGTMRPCVTFEPFHLDPRKVGGIKEAWKIIVEWSKNVPQIIECQTCLFRKECMPCLARHYNDTKEYGKISPKHCFKIQHPEEAAKLQAEYDRRQAMKKAEETEE